MKDVADDLALIVRNAIAYIKKLEAELARCKQVCAATAEAWREEAALVEPATLDEAMVGPRALAQAYENGWTAAKAEPVEPVAWQWLDTAHFRKKIPADATPSHWRPLYTAPPQRPPLSVKDLQDALVYANLIDRDAIDDPDNYDDGSTLAQIDELHRILGGMK